MAALLNILGTARNFRARNNRSGSLITGMVSMLSILFTIVMAAYQT
jgi:hypothetical protein